MIYLLFVCLCVIVWLGFDLRQNSLISKRIEEIKSKHQQELVRYHSDLQDIDNTMAEEMARHRDIILAKPKEDGFSKQRLEELAANWARLTLTQKRIARMDEFSAFQDNILKELQGLDKKTPWLLRKIVNSL
jgi:hypothetical protein